MSVSNTLIRVWIMKFKCLYVKTENESKRDAFSKFGAFLYQKNKKNAEQKVKEIGAVYGYVALAENTDCMWFCTYRS